MAPPSQSTLLNLVQAISDCATSDAEIVVYAGTDENAIRRDTYYDKGLMEGGAS